MQLYVESLSTNDSHIPNEQCIHHSVSYLKSMVLIMKCNGNRLTGAKSEEDLVIVEINTSH